MLYSDINEKVVLREIKKLQPLNYNKFMWWRRFGSKTKPLPSKASFLDRVKNKEYEFSHYYWQLKYCEMEINALYEKYDNDMRMLLMTNAVDLARRKKLIEDFERDEPQRLEDIRKNFMKEFVMTQNDYYSHIEDFNGTIEDFYYYCLKTFDKKKPDRRGRPRKINKHG